MLAHHPLVPDKLLEMYGKACGHQLSGGCTAGFRLVQARHYVSSR